ncbi:Lipoamide acyltransferase component of branched-chain alpha-keto acid dehydrogenase complex [Hibiscus syriacus]|uniref:Dihydrolipoamide acetyltransferase component of pyruvate dehydrogenase complex n=1 Tax=Hibiscus syriacus TaxID=106335 RepID=A0A6A2Y3S6_HIBSY|nr:Lipoamide acyltransferase component of branched-chain alpha-keto acid dehydrogenase complex [Hibiscus syriacus]
MIGRRVLQKRVWNNGRRWLFPSSAPCPVPSSETIEYCKRQLSTHVYASFSSPINNSVNLRFPYVENKYKFFSSNAVADLPTNGIVDVPLAQTGEGIAECELLKWFVHQGDEVDEFQPLCCEVQSDKATIEITSRYKGRVAQVLHVPGSIVKVGETLLKMAVEESRIEESRVPSVILGDLENEKHSDTKLNKGCTGGILSTPAVRNLAKEHGININDVQGSGKDGRVLKEDVLKYAAQTAEVSGHYEDTIVPLRGFQRTMVRTMSMAAKVPHFHYVEEIDCDALAELKASFQTNNSEPGIKFTFLPILIKSLSMALSKYPMVNSCFNEESVEVIIREAAVFLYGFIHCITVSIASLPPFSRHDSWIFLLIISGSHNIGIAMATPYGLVVPNIKNVQSLSILEITKELSRLQQLALDNKLSPNDISGGTITLSNIGAIGGKFGAPIVNLPEVAIIAMGRIQKLPRVADDGDIYSSLIMTVNIGADHRVLDGATVARFCNEWKRFIEKPELLMLNMK